MANNFTVMSNMNTIGKNDGAVHYARADYALLLLYDSKEELEQRLGSIITDIGTVRQGQRLDFFVTFVNDCNGNWVSHTFKNLLGWCGCYFGCWCDWRNY